MPEVCQKLFYGNAQKLLAHTRLSQVQFSS